MTDHTDQCRSLAQDAEKGLLNRADQGEGMMDTDHNANEAARIEAKRRANIIKGMKRAQAKGRHIGRPKDRESIEGFLGKPASQAVIQALSKGLSIRQAARVTGVSSVTVQKVKHAMVASGMTIERPLVSTAQRAPKERQLCIRAEKPPRMPREKMKRQRLEKPPRTPKPPRIRPEKVQMPVLPNPGYVYLIAADTGVYKIGLSANPVRRLQQFKGLPFDVELICSISTDNMRSLEAQLHRRFAAKNVRGEWFSLAAEDVEFIKSLAL